MLIDSHAHLDDKQFDVDRGEVIARAFSSGVKKIINIGAGLGSSGRSVELAKEHENVWAVVGYHPEYFMKHGAWNEEHRRDLEKLACEEKVVGVGEIGLEYHSHNGSAVSKDQKKFQKEGLIFQLELAKKLKNPVVIHCRGERAEIGKNYRETSSAYEDVFEIIQKFSSLNFVFHSFGGRLEFAEKVLRKNNILFSFAGNITYGKPKSETLEVIRKIPLERIMLDSDCPYLSPVPMRGERNEPSYVKYVAEKIGEIKGIGVEEVARVTTKNTENFFNI